MILRTNDIMTESYDINYFTDIDTMVQVANESFNPDCDEYCVTKEGAVGDFFRKVIDAIKKFFMRIIDFFKKLFGISSGNGRRGGTGTGTGTSTRGSTSGKGIVKITPLTGNEPFNTIHARLDAIVDNTELISAANIKIPVNEITLPYSLPAPKFKSTLSRTRSAKTISKYNKELNDTLPTILGKLTNTATRFADAAQLYHDTISRTDTLRDIIDQNKDDVRNTVNSLYVKLIPDVVTAIDAQLHAIHNDNAAFSLDKITAEYVAGDLDIDITGTAASSIEMSIADLKVTCMSLVELGGNNAEIPFANMDSTMKAISAKTVAAIKTIEDKWKDHKDINLVMDFVSYLTKTEMTAISTTIRAIDGSTKAWNTLLSEVRRLAKEFIDRYNAIIDKIESGGR